MGEAHLLAEREQGDDLLGNARVAITTVDVHQQLAQHGQQVRVLCGKLLCHLDGRDQAPQLLPAVLDDACSRRPSQLSLNAKDTCVLAAVQ